MTTLNEGKYPGDVVHFELDRNWSREELTPASGYTDPQPGDVYTVTAGEASLMAAEGEADARGVVLDVTNGKVVGLVRGPAVVVKGTLNYGTGDDGNVDAALL